ncbi:unnamed protein product [Adineta ricciae]|uniref:Uncharacterized protein n=1 Tax=Adineta ricciae TaxID=249248 RepID=A0A815VHU3_ADIRI|nr:unnamed protein product [Adineta ricciae]
MDSWTEGHTGIHFRGVFLHHIDQNNELYVFVLGCYPYDEGDQKAPTIRTFVEKCLEEYGLQLNSEKYVMSDNENKMKSAFNFQCKRIGCSSRYLNKQLEHAFTSETVDKQLVNCVEVQTLFTHVKALVTHTYSDTRFNGAFYMLNVFLMVFDELFPVINSTHLEEFASINKDLLQEICEFLIPFDTVFQELSETNRPTLHRVIPLRKYLLNCCEIQPDDHNGIRKLKIFLKRRIECSWILTDEHYLATIVHPKLKDFQTGSPSDREKAIRLSKAAIQNRAISQLISSSSLSQSFDQSSANNSMSRKNNKPSEKRTY